MYRLKKFFALGLSLILCWTSFMGPVVLYADDTPGIPEDPTQSISQEDSLEDVGSVSTSEGDQNEIDSADTSRGAEDGDALEVDEVISANDETPTDSSLEEEGVSSVLPENAEGEAVDAWPLASSWRYQDGVLVSEQGSVSLYSMSAPPAGATMQGIDVSEFNGDIDWAKVKAAGIDFAILRLGYGEGYVDPKFVDNVHGCQQNDIPFGVYVYCYAWDASSALREGQGAVQRLKQAGIDPSDLALPVYYDMENQDPTTGKPCGVNGNTRVEIQGGPQTFASMAESFASPLQSSGYSVGVYANLNWWNNYLTSSSFNKWDRWVAQYYSSCSYEGDYTIWQYTSSGSVPGISGNVDLNWWYGAPDTSGVKLSAQSGASTITAKASEFPLEPDNVAFCVYHDGAERWYQATHKSDGSWEADINALQDFKSFGSYSISLWATYGIATFEITSSTAVLTPGEVEASSSVLEGGALELSASGWAAAPTNVAFEVVAPSGASRWYAGAESGGAWRAEAAAFEDLGEVGVYAVRVWATIDGVTTVTAEASSELSAGEVSLSAEAEGGALRLSASGWALPARNVAFEVVAPSGASRWYQAERAGDGSWTASVAAGSDFGEWGEYTATAWATYGHSTEAYGSAAASAAEPDVELVASVSGASVSVGVSGWALSPSNVAFEVVAPSGASRWYQAERAGDGSWTAEVRVLRDFGAWGSYAVKAWATFGGVTAPCSSADVVLTPGEVEASSSVLEGGALELSASGWAAAPTNVAFEVVAPLRRLPLVRRGRIWRGVARRGRRLRRPRRGGGLRREGLGDHRRRDHGHGRGVIGALGGRSLPLRRGRGRRAQAVRLRLGPAREERRLRGRRPLRRLPLVPGRARGGRLLDGLRRRRVGLRRVGGVHGDRLGDLRALHGGLWLGGRLRRRA